MLIDIFGLLFSKILQTKLKHAKTGCQRLKMIIYFSHFPSVRGDVQDIVMNIVNVYSIIIRI